MRTPTHNIDNSADFQVGENNRQYIFKFGDHTFSARTVLVGLAVAVVLGAGTTLVTAATLSGTGGDARAPAGVPRAQQSSAAPSAGAEATTDPAADAGGVPFTVAVADVKTPCSLGWILPPGGAEPTDDLTTDQDWQRWAMANAAVPVATAGIRFTVQGRSAAQVVLVDIRVRVVSRKEPMRGNSFAYACGGGGTYQYGSADLDASRPTLKQVAAGSDVAPPQNSEPITAPDTTTIGDAQSFIVAASTSKCLCEWTVEVDWTSEGRSGTQVIDNGGKPFLVTADSNVERHCVRGGDQRC
ncbi:hypothetical protein Val02_22030 [Virgisporangium aliadipatigenens]|uniref:Uncharacterized protein n=1 Tax=Virgisporangium aliadipatigenens TaxID=741659 RepID=A0A8J3YJ16_9ACTN|nr:hypothetical protein [Virgisporangium aliadipatigenens]GIJ45317.1 hypothetical protein Val02_22030 [Virgisporangium aliadipatigenens]